MASRDTPPPGDVDSQVRSAVHGADWTALQHLMDSGQMTDQQKGKVIVETLKSSHVQEFSQHIRPLCSSAQLDCAMAKLVSEGLWTDVISLSQCVGQEHHQWQLGHLSVHDHLLTIVAKGKWRDLSAALQKDTRLSAAEKRWACVQACQRAVQLEIIENVLPRCADKDLDCVLQELVSRGLWWAVGALFSQRRVISESQKTQAINKAAEEATTWELSDFILPHCTKQQLITVSRVLVRRKLWWALGTLLKKDAQVFEKCIIPAFRKADTDLFMSHLMSACHWESVKNLLWVTRTWKHQWQIGEASIHSKLIRQATEGQWSKLAFEAYQSGSTSVLGWIMEEMSKRATRNEIFAVVLHMCPARQIPSVVKHIVARGFMTEAARLLCRCVGEMIEIWTDLIKSRGSTEKEFWEFVQNYSTDLKTGVELFTEVQKEKDLYGSVQLLWKLVWNSMSALQLLTHAPPNQLLCKVLFDSAVHITVVSLCDHLNKSVEHLSIDDEVQLTMTEIMNEIEAAAFSLRHCVLRLCTVFKPKLANNSASNPVYALSVVRAVMRYCNNEGQWSHNTETFLSILTTVPVVPEIQHKALKIMMREKKWSIIGQAKLSYVGEQIRRLLFSSAVKQKQWFLVKEWADHSLSDDQRRWALRQASREKQWDVCLRLAEHGLTEEERTCVHSLVTVSADWKVVLDMHKHEGDILKVRELLSKPTLQKAEVGEKQVREKRIHQLENLEAEVMCRKTSLKTLEAAVEQGDWQVVLFTLRQAHTAHQVSLAVKAAVAGEVWNVVMQLARLGIPTTDQHSLCQDMIRHQLWGVCAVLVEQGLSVELYMDAIPKLMELNQWTLVAKMMDCKVGDAVRRHVMQCAMQRREGSVVSRCIMGMTQPLTVQEKEDLFHRAVLTDTLQAVLPLVTEKDDTGVRHRDMALHHAISQQQWDIVDHCLLHQADINRCDDSGNCPIHEAAQDDDWDTVLALAKRGGDPCLLDSSGTSVIHEAIEKDKWMCVKRLITYCSDLQLSAKHTEEFRTPLEMLTDTHREDIIGYALSQNIDQWKSVNGRGETTLHTICLAGMHDLICPLLNQGVSPLSVTPRGHTALSYAVLSEKHPQRTVARCISLGFSTHQPHISQPMQTTGRSLLSPILLAVMHGLPVVTQMLFESGSCSFRELFHVLPNLLPLTDPHTVGTCSLMKSFFTETQIVSSRQQEAEEWWEFSAHVDKYMANLIKEAAVYLVDMSTTPRSLKSMCRLSISHRIKISGSRDSDVAQLPISDAMKGYVLFSDFSLLEDEHKEYKGTYLTDNESVVELFTTDEEEDSVDEDVSNIR